MLWVVLLMITSCVKNRYECLCGHCDSHIMIAIGQPGELPGKWSSMHASINDHRIVPNL